jgi:hypothetical protein
MNDLQELGFIAKPNPGINRKQRKEGVPIF